MKTFCKIYYLLTQFTIVGSCGATEFGCCQDGKHPAHGENLLGKDFSQNIWKEKDRGSELYVALF